MKVNSINLNEYPILNERMVVYHYNDDQYIVTVFKEGAVKSSKSMKKDAYEVLKRCDGLKTFNEIFEMLFKEYVTSKEELEEFFKIAADNEIVIASNVPKQCTANVFGNGKTVFPKHASIEITSKCNLDCVYCYNYCSPDRTEMMSLKQVENLFNLLSSNGVSSIEITGGEPMIHPNIYEILELALQKFYGVVILSNGVYFPESLYGLIEKNRKKFRGIQISIDGSNDAITDKMRRVKHTFGKTMSTVENLQSRRLLSRLAIVLTEDNINDLIPTCELLRKAGVKNLGITISEEWGRGEDIPVEDVKMAKGYTEYMLNKYKDIFEEVNTKYNDVLFSPQIPDNESLRTDTNCGAGWSSVTVKANGDVIMCPSGSIKLGNVFEDDYLSIFASQQTKVLNEFNLNEAKKLICQDCSYFGICAQCILKIVEINKKRVQKGEGLCEIVTQNKLDSIYDFTLRHG